MMRLKIVAVAFKNFLRSDNEPVPLIRTIPIPPVPIGVEIAAIISSEIFLASIFFFNIIKQTKNIKEQK